MAIVKKFTIGVLPFSKMFRIQGYGGTATDAVLRLRGKELPLTFFSEVGSNLERTAYRLSSEDQQNFLLLSEEHISFTKDYYEADTSFAFDKVLDEFRHIWGAIQKTLDVYDIRRIGMVAEYRYSVDAKTSSAWLREKLINLPTKLITEKFSLRFEEREYAADGKFPDPKESDFINYIYSYYDSAIDTEHPESGFVNVSVDVQRYFTPLLNGNVKDEVVKLQKYFDKAQQQVDAQMKAWGASHGKR